MTITPQEQWEIQSTIVSELRAQMFDLECALRSAEQDQMDLYLALPFAFNTEAGHG